MRDGETALIDRAIRAAAPSGARFVFFPAAAADHPGYGQTVKKVFGRRFRVRMITAVDGVKSPRAAMRTAAVIYLGGGKTELLLKQFRAWRLLPALRAAHARGAVLVGMSAGAEALAAKFIDFSVRRPTLRRGWGIAPVCILVHATNAKVRAVRSVGNRLSTTPIWGVGERAAIVIQGDRIRKVGSGRLWRPS